ncbi:hypothetical protein G8C93_08630 [Cellulosimicrobium cellulans]|uniref:hypothetical protein n=1 Tax=Cellulosimicrobium cellulans TaxID=1710 RepID=UPI0018831582|nr:hypothetical protein [Cellulosimicrobium cellulans]MBE9925956.1 hypothetical protein [Cellulosimicrobium cellulans]
MLIEVLLLLAMGTALLAAVLLRSAYVVTQDPRLRRSLAGWGWPLALVAAVLGLVVSALDGA